MSEDQVPFQVLDNFPETGDLSGQTGSDVIDAAQKVRFRIENVTPRVRQKDGAILTGSISVRASIGVNGVDGNGKYAGKNLFSDLTTYVNTELLTSDWWKKNAMFSYKTFLKALGYDIANPPKVNDAYLSALVGREFLADIKKKEISIKNSDGKYVGTGEFKNELTNFKAVEA